MMSEEDRKAVVAYFIPASCRIREGDREVD